MRLTIETEVSDGKYCEDCKHLVLEGENMSGTCGLFAEGLEPNGSRANAFCEDNQIRCAECIEACRKAKEKQK